MKSFLNTFVISLLLTLSITFSIKESFGQLPPKYYWRTIISPVNSNLKDINSSLIVGENGTILYKSGVNTYTLINGVPNNTFNGVSSFNSQYHTVVGNNGMVYYCPSPLFNNWTLQNSGTSVNLNSIVVWGTGYNAYTRIAVGNGGTILKSIMPPFNWSSWASVTSNTSQNLNAVSLDTSVSVIVGDNGTILRSTNKGDSWSVINSGFSNKLNSVYVFPSDFRNYFVTGDNGLILKSSNAGLNWVQITSGTTENLKSFTPFFICGTNGVVLRSLDSGMTWSPTQTFLTSDLNAITGSEIITVGNAGKILKWDIDSSYIFRKLEGNSISSYFYNSGMFDQILTSGNAAGFEWPKGSGRTAIFTTGISMSAMVQGQLRQAMASYKGEMIPGICNNGVPFTNDTFKVYSVKKSDNPNTNSDWLNWGLMVPYGAPFVDVNNNGVYEPMIDTPGVKNASQTIFICMTDGFTSSHNPGEGFGGGTLPLYNEVHLTAWCYSQPTYSDMQFLKYDIINKGNSPWTRTYFSFVADPDVGDANDDYIGCDTVRKLGYCYNYDNMDGNGNPPTYGTAPPAVGYLLLKGAYRKYVNPGILSMTGFTTFYSSGLPPPCESEAIGEPLGAYYYMMGFKKDSTSWLDPTQLPKKKTKFVYPGDPETNAGWTEYKGSIGNCNNDTSGQILTSNPSGDRRLVQSTGSDEITVLPGDTQRIVMCQLIARGSSNLNSVTKLKQLSDVAIEFYNTNFTIGLNQISTEIPTSYMLHQNYPNPFNPVTKIRFEIPLSKGGQRGLFSTLKVYDILGKEVATLVNEKLSPGSYEVTFDTSQPGLGGNLSSGIYFYRLTSDNFSEAKRMVLIK